MTRFRHATDHGYAAPVRYRDCPTAEATVRIATDEASAWAAVTDIALPTRTSPELRAVRWLDGATSPTVGARFEGDNANDALGEWTTTCTVTEVEPGRRWVYDVGTAEGAWSTWGFEVDPASDGVIVRQWVRMGPARSGLNIAIDAMPDKEARIVARRLDDHRRAMQSTLDRLKVDLEG